MNIALSILSAVGTSEAAGTSEAFSGPWENVYNAINSTAEAVTSEAENVIDRIQALPDAHAQLGDPSYWGSVGIITVTGILVVFFILAILIFLFWGIGKIFQTVDKSKKAKADAVKAAEAAKPAAPAPAPVEEIVEEEDNDEEIMAVISAAIAAYAEEDGTSYTIMDVKRSDKRSRSAWSLAGIGDNTRPF